jgi:UDP-N-acetylmuramoylalanine--D-glutamate ligase
MTVAATGGVSLMAKKPAGRMKSDRIKGRSVLEIGMARSGIASALMLADAGARVLVSEMKPVGEVTGAVDRLNERGIRYEAGGHTLEALKDIEFVVTSPGVPPANLLLVEAALRGLPIYSELEVASWLCEASVIAFTGSNGKTTTTSWAGSIYEHAGRQAQVGGNIGRAFSEFAAAMREGQRAILEVSTFQLERIDQFRPSVAVLLNLSPDHLDRHGSMDEYTRLKFRLLENQTASDIAILSADDEAVVAWDRDHDCGHAQRWWFSTKGPVRPGVWWDGQSLSFDTGDSQGRIPGSDRLIPPGLHNRANAAAAAAAALADGLTPDEIAPGLREFPGVEHRLEMVAEVEGITFVNDSKATNPDAVAKALVSFSRPLVVIMGGLDKGTDFRVLLPALKERARALALTGRAASKLEIELGAEIPYRSAARFEGAFEIAVNIAQPGDVVLLSPGCASFDQFDNYEHRGQVFKQLVRDFAECEGLS